MPRKVTVMLFEDETRWHELFGKVMGDLAKEKSPKYEVRHVCTSTLAEATRLFSEMKPDIVVSDVYIETSKLTDDVVRRTDRFVDAMIELCKDEGEIDETSLATLSDLRAGGYQMGAYYRRDGLRLLDFVRNSNTPNTLFILWSSKLFCSASRLKDVARMKRGPDLILPKPSVGEDDPDLRERLRQGIDAMGSGVWEKVRKLLPWLRPFFLGG